MRALAYYQQAGMSNPVTGFILGTYYSLGHNVEKDLQKGQTLLQQSADAGFSYAYLNLAVLKQQNGLPFSADLNKARLLGNGKAGLLLADTYLLGANNLDEIKQAGQIYQDFAEKGNKDAQMKLGFYFDRGLGGEVDCARAEEWYARAAQQGQPLAQYLLAELYQLGKLNAPDYALAKKWYKASAALYAPALAALGFIYDTVDNNYAFAQQFNALAAAKSEPTAQFNLGLMYEYGKGVAVDEKKAFALYASAAKVAHAKAMTQLAGLYAKGAHGAPDYQNALFWYKKAADLNENQALYQLGQWAEKGIAGSINFPLAVKYYQQAYEAGNEKAAIALAQMYQKGVGIPQDKLKAAEIYKKLVANKNAYAAYQLGSFYVHGDLGEINKQAGMSLLQQSSDYGNKQAGILLQRLQAQKEAKRSFIAPVG